MRSTGLIQKWTKMNFPLPKLCENNTGPKEFSLTDVKSVFFVLIAGLVFSSIVLAVEKIFHFYNITLKMLGI